jgi:hypothetical protein
MRQRHITDWGGLPPNGGEKSRSQKGTTEVVAAEVALVSANETRIGVKAEGENATVEAT